MTIKPTHRRARYEKNQHLSNALVYLDDFRQEIESTIKKIEKLVQRTRWLSKEDMVIVFEWLDTQEKTARNFYQFIHERTRQVKNNIMRTIDKDISG